MTPDTNTVHVPSEAELLDLMAEQMEVNIFNEKNPKMAGGAIDGGINTRNAFPDPSTMADRWTKGVSDNAQKWVEGIQNPRKNFKTEALKAKDSWKNGVQKAIAEDGYAKGISGIDVAQAIATAVQVGAAGYSNGAMARKPKFTSAMTKWVPAASAAVQTVRNMPANTDADREARAVSMMRAFKVAAKTLAGR